MRKKSINMADNRFTATIVQISKYTGNHARHLLSSLRKLDIIAYPPGEREGYVIVDKELARWSKPVVKDIDGHGHHMAVFYGPGIQYMYRKLIAARLMLVSPLQGAAAAKHACILPETLAGAVSDASDDMTFRRACSVLRNGVRLRDAYGWSDDGTPDHARLVFTQTGGDVPGQFDVRKGVMLYTVETAYAIADTLFRGVLPSTESVAEFLHSERLDRQRETQARYRARLAAKARGEA